ncbi:caffeic acid 3-O-methyltransferase-like [Rosa rugosa]|uniref:caffeic acid 3-O-methyltransferase-like n=1 Tax=Rosa rugosa TaxID=74645 RepID=UPI002B404AA7|nr:caffeic acid 3-O-methyltransferase-like [Rosa rugosa]
MDNHSQYAMQLVSASLAPMVLKAAIELGVLDIIHRAGPGVQLSSSEIASQLPSHNNPDAPVVLDRMLRLLSAHSILTCSVSTDEADHVKVLRLYGLAPVAKYFILDQDGGSLATLLSFCHDKVNTDSWYHLTDVVLEGGVPFTKAYGMSVVEYNAKDARYGETFRNSMKEFNPVFMKEILGSYKGFEGLGTLVDAGGGDGTVLNMIVSKYPTIKGINYDLAAVIEKSPSYPGIEHIAGDIFVNIPKGDAIFMKWILHHYDDKSCLTILKNCYEALPDHGKVMVVDMVIPEAPETTTSAKSLFQFDMFMMNMNTNGNERTEKELGSLAKQAGFYTIRVASSAFNFSVVEMFKNM